MALTEHSRSVTRCSRHSGAAGEGVPLDVNGTENLEQFGFGRECFTWEGTSTLCPESVPQELSCWNRDTIDTTDRREFVWWSCAGMRVQLTGVTRSVEFKRSSQMAVATRRGFR